MPFVRKKYTSIYLGSFVPNSVLQSWLPFSSFLSVHGIPKSSGCISTAYSEKGMEVSETQRDSNPLEMFTSLFTILNSWLVQSWSLFTVERCGLLTSVVFCCYC